MGAKLDFQTMSDFFTLQNQGVNKIHTSLGVIPEATG